MKENLMHYRTCVCNINYHMVWSVKYRKKVITPEIEEFMRSVAEEAGKAHGFTVQLFEAGERDHVRCFITAPPKVSVTFIAKCLKGILGRKTLEAFPGLRGELRKGQLWNHSYYAETVGSVSGENIRRYIERQDKQY